MAGFIGVRSISRVEFSFENGIGSPVAISTTAPYTFTFDAAKLPEGSHSVGAKAIDKLGSQNFTYNMFFVEASTWIAHGCQDTLVKIVNNTDQDLGGGIWGTKGAMGSGGFSELVDAGCGGALASNWPCGVSGSGVERSDFGSPDIQVIRYSRASGSKGFSNKWSHAKTR